MLRALWFALKVGVIVAVAIWVANRPGTVELSWLGYNVSGHVGLLLVGLLVFIFVLLFLHRLFLLLVGLPGYFKRRREQERFHKGYKVLTRGLSAVVAGDAKKAGQYADEVRKLWPKDKALSFLLEAQAERLKGNSDKAVEHYKELVKNKDTAFIGFRGLMISAAEEGNNHKALEYARQALALHPKQPWLLQATYDLELATEDWDAANKTLQKAQRTKAIANERITGDRVALLLHKAEKLHKEGDQRGWSRALHAAHKADPASVPAAIRLAEYYIDKRQKRKATALIEKAWKKAPHPDLAKLWEELAPEKKPTDSSARLRWFEKLVALHPDSVESQLAAAYAALDEGLWGEARQYLKMAESIKPEARLYRLWAKLEERLGHNEEARQYLEQAADAPASEKWICSQTGTIYERWYPVAPATGLFNTIEWVLPNTAHRASAKLISGNDILALPVRA